MITDDQSIGLSREAGYAILFFSLTVVYMVLAYKLFSNGEMKFGLTMTAWMLIMTGTGTFCLRSLLKRYRKEQEMKQGKEKK